MKHLRVGNSVAGIMAATLALADCSGSAVAPPVPAMHAAAQTAKASFTIHWPSHAVAAAGAGRKPLFISPSALSVIVEVNPNDPTAGPVTFANANGSATSTVSINAPVGTDEFIFTLWDTLQKPSETQPTGNLLGQADVPGQTVAAGRNNVVNATIGGVTQHISTAPVAGQPFVESDASGGYDLVGDMPVTFSATAYDAGGNVIVAPGAPTLSFSAAGSSSSTIDVLPVWGIQAVSRSRRRRLRLLPQIRSPCWLRHRTRASRTQRRQTSQYACGRLSTFRMRLEAVRRLPHTTTAGTL